MKSILTKTIGVLALFLAINTVWAGGSGYNVVIVVNQNSTNSVQLGNYYREMRQVPPQNMLRINWTGGNTEWTLSDYTNTLLNPLLAMISSRKLTNQVDYVVLSMDIPYRINGGTQYYNSTTSALFYGFKNDPNDQSGCEIAANSVNAYAGSEGIFRAIYTNSATSNYFLTTMITASNLADPEMMVLQGATSDGTFPSQTVWLGKSSDTARNVRYVSFDNSIFNTRLRGNYSEMRTNLDGPGFSSPILGYENGSYYFGLPFSPLFVPGAMADNLTSYGGTLFENNAGQTTLLEFISAGASGTYGTITEPCDYLEKFPDPQNYFYQSRGFAIGECYYQSITNPYQGLVVGEPLAAPFAKKGAGAWNGIVSNAVLSATTNLSVQFTASDTQRPLQQVDLFLDGLYLQTVTNVSPQSATLQVTLNGFAASYAVPAGASVKSIANGLVIVLNGAAYQAKTAVLATQHGDRIELQSSAGFARTGGQIPVSVRVVAPGAPNVSIQTENGSPTNFLDSIARGNQSYILSGSLALNAIVTLTVTKTNNSIVTVSVTNSGNSSLAQFAQQLVTAINTTPALQGPDGLYGDNVEADSLGRGLFDLLAQSGGYAAAQIKAAFTTANGVAVTPATANTLTGNSLDLEPRENLYISAGTSNLAATVAFATTNQADGYHELEAVAYEGTDVRTQTRATQNIIIKNSALAATFTAALSGGNSTLQPTLQFTVTASTNNINTIQLFSTGGVLSATTNQTSATFSVPLNTLDVGLHPFYAIVTDNSGRQYRTQTQNVRLVGVGYGSTNLLGVDYPFTVNFSGRPVTLTFPATAGRAYTIQSTTNLMVAFQTGTIITPTNSLGQWTETNSSPAQQFYRVSVTP